MTALVDCVGLGRRYADRGIESVAAVDGINLTVGSGEYVAVQGPSGSGKSTLLALIAGIELPDAGTVSVAGHDLARLSVAERARLRRTTIGIIFQSFGLVPMLSVAENVALPLLLEELPIRDRRARALEALRGVDLDVAADRRIDELSGGERQRVGVARALVNDPAILLADEPTGNLDDLNGDAVLGLIEAAARERGAAVVIVTHDDGAASRADRALQMRDGHFVEERG